MIRTSFIPRNVIAHLIGIAQNNKTRTTQSKFTTKQLIYIFKYLRRTAVWTRVNKETYTNSNGTLVVTFIDSTTLKLHIKTGA